MTPNSVCRHASRDGQRRRRLEFAGEREEAGRSPRDVSSLARVSKEEIAEATITARFALASTTFVSAVEGMEYLTAAS